MVQYHDANWQWESATESTLAEAWKILPPLPLSLLLPLFFLFFFLLILILILQHGLQPLP